jgi:hypothetical protein
MPAILPHMHNLLSRVRRSPLLLAALMATTLAGTHVLAHAKDHGLLMDLGDCRTTCDQPGSLLIRQV